MYLSENFFCEWSFFIFDFHLFEICKSMELINTIMRWLLENIKWNCNDRTHLEALIILFNVFDEEKILSRRIKSWIRWNCHELLQNEWNLSHF